MRPTTEIGTEIAIFVVVDSPPEEPAESLVW